MFSQNPKVADKELNSEEISGNINIRPNGQWKRKWSPLFGTGPVIIPDPNSDASSLTNARSMKRRHT